MSHRRRTLSREEHDIEVPTHPASRRLAIAAVLRSLVLASVVVAGYSIVPLGGPRDGSGATRLAVVLVTVVTVYVASHFSIQRARHPMLRAIESIALFVPLLIVGFASTYGAIAHADTGAFSEPLDHVGALYFSMATSTTVGFGDIAATSAAARIATMAQMLSNVVVIGLGTRAVFSAARAADRRSDGDASSTAAPPL